MSLSVTSKSGSRNNQRRNLLFVSLLVVVLVVSLCVFVFVVANGDGVVHVKNEVELRQAVNDAPYAESVTIIFDNDITLSRGTLVIPIGKNIVLTSDDNEFFKLISTTVHSTLGVNGILTLDGIVVTHATGYRGCGVEIYVGGILNLYSGKISGNGDGGVYNSGVFKMCGGEIVDNITSDRGGGVHNAATSSFEMSGGKIFGNTANWGGGVFNAGMFKMFGGELFNNSARVGGGVFNNSGSAFNGSDGVIIDNTSTYYDNDVYNLP